MTNTTRRTILAGLAAAPVAGLPVVAGVAPLSEPLAVAMERHRAAQAAVDAACGHGDLPEDVCDREAAALYALAIAPCANDSELIVKLRYLLTCEKRCALDQTFDMSSDGSLPIALEAHFNPEPQS
jgi:hypothetical protein